MTPEKICIQDAAMAQVVGEEFVKFFAQNIPIPQPMLFAGTSKKENCAVI